MLKVGDKLSSFEDMAGFAQENGVVVQVHERYYTVEYFDNDMQEMHQAKVPKASIKPSNVVNVDTKPAEGNTSAEEKQDRVSDEVKESDADEGQEHVGKEEGGDAETVELVQKIFDAINPNHNGKLAKTEFKKAIFTNPDVGMLLSADETLSILKHPMHLEEPFQSLDTNHDGFVSADELLAFATTLNNTNNDEVRDVTPVDNETVGTDETVELVQKIFDAINPNHNGKLAKTEFKKAIFTNPDVGMLLSADETLSILKHPMHLEEPFQSLDTNHDGFVSADELLAFATTLNNTNNDEGGDVTSLETNGESQTVVDDSNYDETVDLIQNDAGDQGILPSDAAEECVAEEQRSRIQRPEKTSRTEANTGAENSASD